MTIEKGKEWGHRGACPTNLHFARTDTDLIVQWQRDPTTIFAMLSGDLYASLGRPKWGRDRDLASAPEVQFLPVDIFRVVITTDDSLTNENVVEMFALSSVEIGSWFTRRRYVCVSNCGFVGDYNIAPRAHPNDGEMDVVTIQPAMEWRQRLQARSRARLGQHVPHPAITMERGVTHTWTRESSRERLCVDGVAVKTWREMRVEVLADACSVVV
jgi:hypothetical protein